MKTKLMMWMSGAALALAGCTSDSSHVGNQSPQNSYYNYPTESQQPQQTYDYTPRQEPYPQPAPQSAQPAPQYPDQAPQYDQQPQEGAPQYEDVPTVERTQDFERPLAEHGRWLETPEYGRVWQPHDQPANWRPYSSDGRWVYTRHGWTWESYQPWGWACYHYGNWVYQPRCGWVWVPGTVWAPAWVEWHESDDYIAWAPAPIPHGPRFFASVEYYHGVRYVDFVIVERRNFCRPIAPVIVIGHAHNVKIVHKTVNITKIKVVNKVAVNHGPQVSKIERSTNQKVRVEKVRDVVKTPEQFTKKHREEHVSKQTVREQRVQDDKSQDKANRVKLDFEKSTKQQAVASSPVPSVNVPQQNTAPAPTRKEEKKADKEEKKAEKESRQNSGIVYHDGARRVDKSPVTTQPAPVNLPPREVHKEKQATPANQPAPEVRSAPTRRDAEADGKSEKKAEKQIQRGQSANAAPAPGRTYTPRPESTQPPVQDKSDRKAEKQIQRGQAAHVSPSPARVSSPRPESTQPPAQDKSDRKSEKQVQREQQRQSAGSYTPYTPRPANNMPAPQAERSQKVEKQSKKEQVRSRDEAVSSDQYNTPYQNGEEGNGKKERKRDGQTQDQY